MKVKANLDQAKLPICWNLKTKKPAVLVNTNELSKENLTISAILAVFGPSHFRSIGNVKA